MSLEVSFAARDGAGNELIARRALATQRVFRLDRDNIVGSSEEQALLLREMRTDIVERIIRSLGTVARRETDATQV